MPLNHAWCDAISCHLRVGRAVDWRAPFSLIVLFASAFTLSRALRSATREALAMF
jgi:hypothetical protein